MRLKVRVSRVAAVLLCWLLVAIRCALADDGTRVTVFDADGRESSGLLRMISHEAVRIGEPPVERIESPEGPALWLAGDRDFSTGVLSRDLISANDGMGLEAELSTPINAMKWQWVELMLTAGIDSATLANWRMRNTDLPQKAYGAGANCSMRYPSGREGTDLAAIDVNIGGREFPVALPGPPSASRRVRFRLQLFPDGTCGFALDGRPIWRSIDRVNPDLGYRVALDAQSYQTRLLVGPVTTWVGVRTDVDWGTLAGP